MQTAKPKSWMEQILNFYVRFYAFIICGLELNFSLILCLKFSNCGQMYSRLVELYFLVWISRNFHIIDEEIIKLVHHGWIDLYTLCFTKTSIVTPKILFKRGYYLIINTRAHNHMYVYCKVACKLNIWYLIYYLTLPLAGDRAFIRIG